MRMPAPERIQELAAGIVAGDAAAMEAFFTFVRAVQKDVGAEAGVALAVIVDTIELLLPADARLAYSVVGGKKGKPARKSARPPKSKSKGRKAAKAARRGR
jgi:hypothetical protein